MRCPKTCLFWSATGIVLGIKPHQCNPRHLAKLSHFGDPNTSNLFQLFPFWELFLYAAFHYTNQFHWSGMRHI